MAMTRDQVRRAALELAPDERQALAEELLLSISGAERDAIDSAWLAEVRRRDAAFAEGTSTGRPVNQNHRAPHGQAASMTATILADAVPQPVMR